MPALADVQSWIARAVLAGGGVLDAVDSASPSLAVHLRGGANPRVRLAIHVRHYETSLAAALATRFPATAWLAGAQLVGAAARAFVHARPPRRPCIAEYGADFPEFLEAFVRARALPYLRSFAELERAIGQASIAVDGSPLPWSALVAAGTERLLETCVALQPGVRYVRAAWRIDELMTTFLGGAEPDVFELDEADTCIEVRGSRGALHLERVDLATFAFRAALAAGGSIGEAAGAALELDGGFDTGEGLRRLVQAGLAIGLRVGEEETKP